MDIHNLINLANFQFVKGTSYPIECEIWADGGNKPSLPKVEGEEMEKYRKAQDEHTCKIHFKFTENMSLKEFMNKLMTSSNSPRVAAQNALRPTFKGDEKAAIEFATGTKAKPYEFDLNAWVAADRGKKPAEDKVLSAFDKLSPEQQAEFLKKIQER